MTDAINTRTDVTGCALKPIDLDLLLGKRRLPVRRSSVQALRNARFVEEVAHGGTDQIDFTRSALCITWRSLCADCGKSFCSFPSQCDVRDASPQGIYWQTVDQILSRKPAVVSGDLRRYSFPRTDLRVTLDGVTIKPALALGGWVAFKQVETQVAVMGDLVLLEAEINPVMQKMIEGGLEITAVRNVLLRANPTTFHVHIGGRGRIGDYGDAIDMATAIRLALVESNTPRVAISSPGPIDLDTAQLDQIMGVKGGVDGGIYQFAFARRDPITMEGIPVSPAAPMGVATGIVTADEVKPVIEALRAGGIEVTGLQSHMLNEQPHLFFVHFWANDDAIKLAKGLRTALSRMANAKS